MSIPTLVGAAIGLVFVFALAALFCSAITEIVANLTERRARYLLTGLRSMLDEETSVAGRTGTSQTAATQALHGEVKDAGATGPAADRVHGLVNAAGGPAATGGAATAVPAVQAGDLTLALFDHSLIRSLQTRRVFPFGDGQVRNPQYIPPKIFAQALMDTLLPAARPATSSDTDALAYLRSAVLQLPDRFAAKQALLGLVDNASDSIPRFEAALEAWYDAEMGRISGWYKRWARVVLAVVGLVLAILVNVDTVQIAHDLYVNDPLRQATIAQASSATCSTAGDIRQRRECAAGQLTGLTTLGLPIGWRADCGRERLVDCVGWTAVDPVNTGTVLLKLLGFGLTAFAVSFGAPFWFDALSKLGSLSSAGTKPDPS